MSEPTWCPYCNSAVDSVASVLVDGDRWHGRCREMWEHDQRTAAMMERVSKDGVRVVEEYRITGDAPKVVIPIDD